MGASFGCLGVVLEPFGAVLGASCAVLDTWKSKEANIVKMYVFLREWDDFCLSGVPLGASQWDRQGHQVVSGKSYSEQGAGTEERREKRRDMRREKRRGEESRERREERG